MSSPFQVGDVVELKSGGTKMTVEEGGEECRCVWFVKDEKKVDYFTAGLLKKVAEWKG